MDINLNIKDIESENSGSCSESEIINDYVVLTTVNKNYLKIFDIWYQYYSKTSYKPILHVITLDKKSEEHIGGKSIKTISLNNPTNNFSKVIHERTKVIRDLLKEGKNIIHTDSDAFWINPKLDKIINKKYDIQGSIGYGIPYEAISKWGFAICTGFVIVHSNPNTISFSDQWANEVPKFFSDQKAFNHLLLRDGVEWRLNEVTKNIGYNKEFGLNIEAISHDIITRPINKNAMIYHPFLPSNHQNIKIIDLIKRLKQIDNRNDFLDQHLKSVMYNPIGWMLTTYGWAGVVFHKGVKRIKQKYFLK